MASLADRAELVGFFSYSREDDEDSNGALSALRDRIQRELRQQLGRSAKDFRLWQDKQAIPGGSLWEAELKKAIRQSAFFIPIITPTAIKSSYCRTEFEEFAARERLLERNDLIFPILYIRVPALENEARRAEDPLLSMIASRQYVDWRELRHREVYSTQFGEAIERFCSDIMEALSHPQPSDEELARQRDQQEQKRREQERRQEEVERRQREDADRRQEEEAGRLRRKQEAIRLDAEETRRRAEEGRREQEARRREEETRRQEEEARRRAEEERRQREQEEQLRRDDRHHRAVEQQSTRGEASPEAASAYGSSSTERAHTSVVASPGTKRGKILGLAAAIAGLLLAVGLVLTFTRERSEPSVPRNVADLPAMPAPGVQTPAAATKVIGGNEPASTAATAPAPPNVAGPARNEPAAEEPARNAPVVPEPQRDQPPMSAPQRDPVPAALPRAPVVATRPTADLAGFRDCADCPEMVVLPRGAFIMGSETTEAEREGIGEKIASQEQPRHRVTLSAKFAVGRFPVTRAEFRKFVPAAISSGQQYRVPAHNCVVSTNTHVVDSTKNWEDAGIEQTESDPVVCVSWEEASSYADWLSKRTGYKYRLLTEAEWEYAARAGSTTARYWGDNLAPRHANCDGCSSLWDNKSTSPVGSFSPNKFGLFDMLGNVFQWVSDCWTDSYDPGVEEKCESRVYRGGSFITRARNVRAAYRSFNWPTIRVYYVGFRVAADLDSRPRARIGADAEQ